MTSINRLTVKPVPTDKDLFPIWDADSSRTRSVTYESIKDNLSDLSAGTHVESGTYSAGTLTLKLTDNTEVVITGWTDLTGIMFSDDNAEVGNFKAVNFKGDGVQVSHANGELQVEIDRAAIAPTLALQFSGIYDTLQDLTDAVAKPSDHQQAIVLQPSEKYYHGVGNAWVELAPVGSFHPNYLGAYDTVDDLKAAEPSPADDSLAIVGTDAKSFYIYTNSKWDQVTHTDLPSLDARVTDAEGKITSNINRIQTAEGHLQSLQTADGVLQSNIDQKISGIHVEDADKSNAFDDINSLHFVGAEVAYDGSNQATITAKPKITVANGQETGSTSLEGNSLIFPGDTITADPNDPNVLILGRTDTPKFDPSIFQSAVDHGYAADDQGVKSNKTTDGWWIFKDVKSVSGRPSGAIGDLILFKNTIDTNNVALKHVFMMAIGQDKDLESKMWFSYRDGTQWTSWFSEQGADQSEIDRLTSSVNELKSGNAAIIKELEGLQTAAGNLYAPTKEAFNKAVTALINAALANYTPAKPSHGGDKPSVVYPRFYAQFSLGVPADFTGATTSTNAEATLLRIPTTRERIFISVENDNDEASKVTGFKFNNKQEMSLAHRDIVLDGKKYRAFYTAGAFSEQKVDIKVDFGQGI